MKTRRVGAIEGSVGPGLAGGELAPSELTDREVQALLGPGAAWRHCVAGMCLSPMATADWPLIIESADPTFERIVRGVRADVRRELRARRRRNRSVESIG